MNLFKNAVSYMWYPLVETFKCRNSEPKFLQSWLQRKIWYIPFNLLKRCLKQPSKKASQICGVYDKHEVLQMVSLSIMWQGLEGLSPHSLKASALGHHYNWYYGMRECIHWGCAYVSYPLIIVASGNHPLLDGATALITSGGTNVATFGCSFISSNLRK